MNQVTVLRADNSNSLESLNNITNSIRNRAAQLAQSGNGSGSGTGSGSGSGSGNGTASDATRNWLQAERDLFRVPESTLSENDQQFNIQVLTAGRDAANLQVIATSDSLVVLSMANSHMNTSGNGSIVYSDVDSRTMFRRFDLSSSIDTSQVTATLDNGMLSVAAQKASANKQRSSAAKA